MSPLAGRSRRLGRALAAALALLSVGSAIASLALSGPRDADDLEPEIERRWSALWSGLDALAAQAAPGLAGTLEGEQADFRALEAQLPPSGDRSLVLLDAFGQPLAWAGSGLAHEVAARALPRRGHAVRASFTTVTLLAVEPVPDSAPPRRVAAAVSYTTDRLPFPLVGRPGLSWRWSAATDRRSAAGDDVRVIGGDGVPWLLLAAAPDEAVEDARAEWLRRAALVGFGLAALLWGWLRDDRGRGPRVAGSLAAVGLLGAAAGGGAAVAVALFGLGVAAAVWGPRSMPRPPGSAPWLGALSAVLVLAAAWGLQRFAGPFDLGRSFAGGAADLLLRLGLWGFAFALLGTTASCLRPGRRLLPLWQGASVLLLAAASIDVPGGAAAALVAGTALVAPWLASGTSRPRGGRLVALGLLAALLPAIASEIAFRRSIVDRAPERLALLGPPTQEDLRLEAEELSRYFRSTDVSRLSPADVEELEATDLAYALWRRAPLRQDRALSGIAVAPVARPGSTFALGLSVAEGELIDWPTVGPGSTGVHLWDYTLLTEEAPVALRGRPWASVRYWLLPQPGYGLGPGRGESLSRRLLRGGPGLPQAVEEWLRPLRYGFYDQDGPALVSPWTGAPPLTAELAAGGRGSVATPEGSALIWTAIEPDGVRALFLPRLGPLAAVERVGTDATGALMTVLALVLVGLAAQALRPETRARLRRPLRSYSVRLMVLFALLLLVPAVVVNLLLLRATASRLDSDRIAAGEEALEAAERVLGDYAAAQAPGVAFDTVLDDGLLDWLATVVRHEVNLYFGGTLYATSKRPLFTAGLLPERIPGEVYARLAVEGHEHAVRRSRVGDLSYRELYAPLSLPGPRPGASSLVVSVPLLGQDEQVSRELADIRRKVILSTVGLLLLLAALGARLARSFTTPLTDILDGTRRIAAGAASLGVEPPPLDELARLVEAIDRMALRIAQTRGDLEREKRVMERILESITSAVVSLDSRHRVVMQNEVAGALLGTTFDRPIEEALTHDERLAEILEFVAGPAQLLRSATVRLPAREDEEPEEWTLSWVPIAGDGDPAALLVVEDLRGPARPAAGGLAEMARMIAHEIKNPLTPIRLSAEHMREVRQRDPGHFDEVFARCTANILTHVDELQEISSDFSIYSRIPHRARGRRPRDLRPPPRRGLPDGAAARRDARLGGTRSGAPRPLRPEAPRPRPAQPHIENALRGGAPAARSRSASNATAPRSWSRWKTMARACRRRTPPDLRALFLDPRHRHRSGCRSPAGCRWRLMAAGSPPATPGGGLRVLLRSGPPGSSAVT
ncbi:MAG: histidine kinase dimerization/phospho-acceptor domain-containing protein [Thermoanaerobaculia bacterium]